MEIYDESHDIDCECRDCHDDRCTNDVRLTDHVIGLWDRFITVTVGDVLRVVDLKLIEPFLKVISHGGMNNNNIIII